MKTMEEKASEVVARWQELHPGGGPTSLSVADIRAAKDQLLSRDVFRRTDQSTLRPCLKCGSFNTNYNDGKVYARCRNCNAWWTPEDAETGHYRTGGEPIDPPPKQVYRVPWNSIDWEVWRKNMGSAINRTAIIIDGANRGNNNARLRNIKPPVTWFDDIAVGEKDEGFESAMWSVVPPEGFEITFFGDNAKDKATKMAEAMLVDRRKK